MQKPTHFSLLLALPFAVLLQQCSSKASEKTAEVAATTAADSYTKALQDSVAALPAEGKSLREKSLAELAKNSVYRDLKAGATKAEYLPLLAALSEVYGSWNRETLSVPESIEQAFAAVPNGQDFFASSVRLITHGGLPNEYRDIFKRNALTWRYAGQKGTMIVSGNDSRQRMQAPTDYNLAPAMAVMFPEDAEPLEQLAQAAKQGLWHWKDEEHLVYPVLADKKALYARLQQLKPDSKMLPTWTSEVPAQQLFAEYEANEVAADAKYEDKRILTTGVVEKIGKDISGRPYVALATTHPIGSVQCLFDDPQQVMSLSKGDEVAAAGICKGKMLNVILEQCSIE